MSGDQVSQPDPGSALADTGNCEVSGCAEVIAEVWTLLDGECSSENSARLRHHLEECPGCLQQYGIEEQIKLLVARKCGGDKAPEGLRDRIKLQITRTTTVIRQHQPGEDS